MGTQLTKLIILVYRQIIASLTHPRPQSIRRWIHIHYLIYQLLRLEWKRHRHPTISTKHHPSISRTHEHQEKTLVFVGGGHAHLYSLLYHRKRQFQAKVVLVSQTALTPYSGMVPGVVAGIYESSECHIDLQKLCEGSEIEYVQDEATHVDTENNKVILASGDEVDYDLLSIDVGSEPRFLPDKELPSSIVCVKPISTFLERWDYVKEEVMNSGIARIVVVGGGAGGIEVALSIHYRLQKGFEETGQENAILDVSLVTSSKSLVPDHNSHVQNLLKKVFKRRNVKLILNARVMDASENELVLENGDSVSFDHCFWCTQAGTHSWFKNTNLELTEGGFIAVRDTLQSVNEENVFAVGDCSLMVNNPRPRAGVFAVRQGPILFRNLHASLNSTDLEDYEPQEEFLALISTGTRANCIASKGDMGLEGAWLWTLKDWIDRSWLSDYMS